VVLLAARAVAGGGLRSALGTETSLIALQSKMFQHFAQPLATAAAATADLDDAGEGCCGARSHATWQAGAPTRQFLSSTLAVFVTDTTQTVPQNSAEFEMKSRRV